MGYSFKGFLSKAANLDQNVLMQGHVYREVTVPFIGCGILTPDMVPSFEDAIKYLNNLGISNRDWIFLEYDTWAGPVDYVRAIGSRSGARFGPIEGDGDPAEDAFYEALGAFGLGEDSGVMFAPFERGFWGDL